MNPPYLYTIYICTVFFCCCSMKPHKSSESTKALEISQQSIIAKCINIGETDSFVFEKLVKVSKEGNWEKKPLGETMIKVAEYFMNVPYVAATLEGNEVEQLVINLREMDCTTFVENVLALSRCINNGKLNMNDYVNELTLIRYRDGIINEYPSRLHYFTEWITNNSVKGIIELVTEEFGQDDFRPQVNFMSQNPDKYDALTKNPSFITSIALTENEISKNTLKYIPKEKLVLVEHLVKTGDIIAITTNIKGLDIAHVGIAIQENGRLNMIHASLTFNKVVMTQEPLANYLAGIKRQTGILVARPLNK